MIPFLIKLDDTTAEFYTRVSAAAEKPVETVISDALFKLAGELSLEALAKAERNRSKK